LADIKESKNFLSLEGLTHYHEKISAKIDKSTFSKDYEELKNKPTIQNLSVDETTETLFVK
jgi:hypothetical protein